VGFVTKYRGTNGVSLDSGPVIDETPRLRWVRGFVRALALADYDSGDVVAPLWAATVGVTIAGFVLAMVGTSSGWVGWVAIAAIWAVNLGGHWFYFAADLDTPEGRKRWGIET